MAEAVGYSKLQDDLNANGYTNLIKLILVSDGTYQTQGSQNSAIKVPYLYPSALGRTNLAVVAGVGAPLGFARAVILDKSGNKVETFSLYYTLALSLTRPADYQTVRTKLINAAHTSGLYPPYTSVSYPIGGETLIRNQSWNITWDHANLGGNVTIELYKGGILNSTIASNTLNSSGTYSWAIPAGQTVASDYKIRVTPLSFPAQYDESNVNFSIRNAKITVTYPNGGQSFNVYNAPNITWDPDGAPGNVKIELYKGGALNSTINASVANSGTYAWAIPDALAVGSDYKVMVTPVSDPSAADLSDANFTIRSPKMTVTYPNGGETVNLGANPAISWKTDSVTGNAKVELFKGGALFSTIAASTTNSGSCLWPVPGNQGYGSDYTVRVTPLAEPSAADDSNAAFSIIPVVRQVIYSADMSSNPGWTLGTSWAYGKPTGAGQDAWGNPDPTSGYTGTNVIGYRLTGDYEGSITATRWARTMAIDCSAYSSVQLVFWRWLGVESPAYDHASIEVSSNGTTWVSVWTNTNTVDDSSWTLCEYDISATAGMKSTVYIRWGLGPTDSEWNYCGWNLDDVQLLGVRPYTTNWTPYSWLADNGITSNQVANELLDPDNDGMPTWMEYQAGTNPNDSNSVFCVFDISHIAGTNRITWYGTTNSGLYTDFIIDRCTNLSSSLWTPAGTNSRSASGTNVWMDSNPPPSGPAFYRPRLR